MHSPVLVALLHTPHVEQMAMAFQAAVLEPLVRRGVMRLTARQAVFSRDHLLLEQIEHAQLFIVFLSQGVDQAHLRGLSLLENLRLRHGRSALVLPVLAQATFESLAEGFLPLPLNVPPDDAQALSRLAPAVELALTDVRSLKTNHGEYPPSKPIMGREHVLEDMHRFFAGGAARFICLTAPFGRGASSIARAYAESIKHEFPGGCIDMSSLDDDEASRRLAQSLGIHTLPSNLQSPAVLLNEVLAARTDTLVLLDMSFRQYAKVSAPMLGARTIITTHVEMNVPTAYTYQVPKLDELGRTRLARHLGLDGPLADLPEGEPLAYYLLRGIRALERDDEKIAHALKQAKELNRKADLHESWLTPIAAFFAVWWSLLPEETRRVVGALSLCPPSGILPQERAERFADMENSFAAALEPLRVTELIAPTNASLLAVQPALLAWLERFQPEIRIAACQRAEKAQERVFLDLERLELEHTKRGTDGLIEEIGAIQVGPKARSCAVTNDGTFVISAHEDGVVRVWRAESGHLVAERADRFPVQAMVAIGPTSFAHSELNVFRVVDVRTPADVTRVPAAAASALPTSSSIAEVILPERPWPVVDDAISTQHEHCQYTFSQVIPREEIARDWAVRAMTDAPSGELILLGNDGTISVLNLETKSVVRRSKPPFADPFWPALSVDGTMALSVAPRQKPPEYTDSEGPAAKRASAVEVPGRKSMILWNTLSNEVLGTLPREVEPSMLFTKTAAGHVFLATREGMEIWDLQSGKMVNHRRGECVAISKSGRWAAVRTEDGILIEEVDSGKPLRLVRGISGMRGKCLLRHDGRAFVTTESSTDLCFVDTENGTVFRSPQLNWNTEIRAFGFSADESLVFVAMKDGTIDIRETFTGLLRGQGACPERLPIRYLVTTPRLVVCDDRVGLHLFEPWAQRV